MAVDDTAPRRGPIALADLFDAALKDLVPEPNADAPPSTPTPVAMPTGPASGDAFLFSGNRHETVPRRLFLDRRLTPLERNAWQVFRLMLNDDGVTAFPTYEQLRPWLASMPCAGQASHETVARALTLLRLTRWLSLVRRRRDPKTGRILGNLYVLHDEPLTPFEAMQLDADYLALVSQSLGHSAKTVQMVSLNTLKEIAGDPLLSGRTLPSRLQVLAERLASQGITATESYPQEDATHDSEEGPTSLLRNPDDPTSESEAGSKPAPDASLRNPKQARTVRSSRINEVRTTAQAQAQARALGDLQWPKRFAELKAEQQTGARVALQQVDAALRQAVLDEWATRCSSHGIRNPAGYLFGIIQRAHSSSTACLSAASTCCNATRAPV
ncbi:STY4528 family pathogenicity island replication protein, partial [uncultured Aquabacterium sp.]|uniref:STY4528 family pathogenicity island replication protein n=1 Tax=uncultured Aquabacterium sp. TaxID=158753 RepID=UPI0025D51275